MERRNSGPGRTEMDRLNELERRVRELDESLTYAERLEYEQRHREQKDARLALGKGEAELDGAVDESFPASDAASPARSGDDNRALHDRTVSAELDEALDDTFPASDTPSLVAPRHEDH